MKHLEALRVLPRYFESGLDRETTRAFHEHLKTCTECREQIKLMRKFRQKSNTEEAPDPARDRRRSRGRTRREPKAGRASSLNARHLADPRNQRRLVYQVLLAAVIFFFAVRMGLIERLFR